jgi:hypothetical protein
MKAARRPSLNVIDKAIQKIKKSEWTFTCIALEFSVSSNASVETLNLYSDQWKAFVLSQNRGRKPIWWNSSFPYKEARIAALKGFRKACIDAAKRG